MTSKHSLGAAQSALARRLLDLGILEEGGHDVDFEVYRRRTNAPPEELLRALRELVQAGLLREQQRRRCVECDLLVIATLSECPDCRTAILPETAVEPVFSPVDSPPARDPRAVFLVHGMNSRGGWQERLAWRLSLLYGYSVPVRIFKYGDEVWSPFWEAEQRTLADALDEELSRTLADLSEFKPGAKCDIVAHSFGTLLLSRVLEKATWEGVTLGRVILTGSIVRRDFDWDDMIATGRIEAVLNHRAGADSWVRFAPWAFPSTGSSGRDGFVRSVQVVECESPGLSHSGYFIGERFEEQIKKYWEPFMEGRNPPARVHKPPKVTILLPTSSGYRYLVGRVALFVLLSLLALLSGLGFWYLCTLT